MKPQVHIKKITFNDQQTFEFSFNDIIVFTGPNNAGKSQILRDIKKMSESEDNDQITIQDILIEKTGESEEMEKECIVKDGYFYLDGDYIGNKANLEYIWNQKYLKSLVNKFINHLSTEERLQTSTPPSSFNSLEASPHHPIQKLYSNDEKESELSEYFHKAFGQSLIVNRGAGSIIPLHVGEKPIRNAAEDRVSYSYLERLVKLPQLQQQGDGMRSFAGILLNVFTSDHTITLIDEPEAFLHPPQARLLGKMLANNKPNNRQLFISTHSEDFLKGLLDANSQNTKIFRINRSGNINHMSQLENEDIKKLWKDPLLRYSNILSGLFHSKIVICESDIDCRFYQAIMNAIYENTEEISPDILFAHCGGKHRLKTVIKAMKALNVKTVAIADIDILNDKDTFKEITDSLGINWNEVEKDWKIIFEYVKDQRAQIDTQDIKREINQILDAVSMQTFPQNKAEEIKKILNKSSAWSKVKEVGKSFMQGDSYNSFNKLNQLCRKYGLFIVPVGELEMFYKPISGHGTKWINNVLETVSDLNTNSELKDAREFTKSIVDY